MKLLALDRGLVAAVWAAIALSFAAPVTAVSAQGRLTAHYAITAAGVSVGQVTWSVDVGETRYAAAAFGKASGMLSVLLNGEGSAVAQGLVDGGHLTPVTFVSAITDDEGDGELRMAFDNGVVTELIAPPSPKKQPRVPVTDADRRGVSDPLSAVLIPIEPSGDPLASANCDHVLSIFDGRRRYDLAMSFKRVEKIALRGFSGLVLVCGVVLHPIAGHRPDSLLVKHVAGRKDMEAWFAPIPGAGVIAPVRVNIPTMLGTLAVSADQFEGVAIPSAPPPR